MFVPIKIMSVQKQLGKRKCINTVNKAIKWETLIVLSMLFNVILFTMFASMQKYG